MSAPPALPSEPRSRRLQAAVWLRGYGGSLLRGDLLGGLTLAAYLVPAGLADASLANLPPQAGLYACLFSGLVFWLFCSSRHTAITVTSAISLLVGASVGGMADGDVTRFGAFAAGTALITAAVAFLAYLARAGAVVDFISESVMIGFKCGVALFLASTQLPKLFGFSGSHGGGFWERAKHFATHLPQTHAVSLAVGVSAFVLLMAGKILLKNKPVALFVVLGGMALAAFAGLEARGVKLLGEVPRGLPMPGLPKLNGAEFLDLIPLALACFMLGAVETAAIGRMFGSRHGNRLNANQEFLALSTANLAAALGRGLPVSGGMSQSLVNESSGARTPLSGLVAALLTLVVILFFSGFLRHLPQPVLAAVVLSAVTGLFNVSALKNLWKSNRQEFLVAGAALLGVLWAGLLKGVLVGGVISLVLLLRRASRPHVALLGRIPGSRRFSDFDRHPDNELIPGVVVVRPEAGLLYFNVEHVCDEIRAHVQAQAPAKLVVLDLSASAHVDMQSAHVLATLAEELAKQEIRVQVVETRSSVRDRLRNEGVDEKLGGVNRFTPVADAVDRFLGREVPGPDSKDPD